MLSESLKGIIAQVLCKKRGGGRAAAFEVLIANSAVANLIRESKTYQLASIMQTGRKTGMQTMSDHLLELVKNKTVDPKEAYIKSNDKAVFRELLEREGIRLQLDK
jgi:twitching motility protein PilT